MDRALVVEHLFREFPPTHRRRSLLSLLRSQAEPAGPAAPRVLALQDISLSVERGEKIGVIGNNAAGKTTLLKVLAGLLRPTRGTVRVQGERALVTAMGAGMLDELSLEDNVVLYGALYGVDRSRMRSVLPEILEWSGLAGSQDAELRTLSAGTRARLAFGVLRHIEAEVFLLDEALSAGDFGFRAKCHAHFVGPRYEAGTFVVATHDMEFVRTFCSKVLWLSGGRQMEFGPSAAVVAAYLAAKGG